MRQASALQLEEKLDAARQMAWDEALLVCAPADSLILRFYAWAGPALTFGYGQPWAIAAGAAAARGVPEPEVVRRATGGGIVFHDGDLTFSLCFPWTRISSPVEIDKKVHRGVLRGLREVGVEARLWVPEAGALKRPQAQCFAGPEPFDLVDGAGRKVLGGALRRRSGRGLYQGSLRLDRALEVRAAMNLGLAQELGGSFSRIDLSWIRAGAELAEKYRSDAWNKRR